MVNQKKQLNISLMMKEIKIYTKKLYILKTIRSLLKAPITKRMNKMAYGYPGLKMAKRIVRVCM
jgi:hypothetical protein